MVNIAEKFIKLGYILKIDLETKFLPSRPKIAFTQLGAGELVVLIHGIGGNKENWYSNIEIVKKL